MTVKWCPVPNCEEWFTCYEDLVTHLIGKHGYPEINAKSEAQAIFW
jgi:hypothetical protein